MAEVSNPPQAIDEPKKTYNRDGEQGFVERLVFDGEAGDQIEGVTATPNLREIRQRLGAFFRRK